MNQSDPSDDTPRDLDQLIGNAEISPEPTDDSAAETGPADSDAVTNDSAGDATTQEPSKPAPPSLPPSAKKPKKSAAEEGIASPIGGEQPLMDWYILKVAFNREDSIADALRKRIKMEGMEEFFDEIVVPTEDVATFTRDGKRRISKRKLLPGYVMARMVINDDTWFLVRETAGISDFTGAAGKPMPMEPEDVERFINRVPDDDEEEAPIKTAIPFKVGDRVRVKEGNFENQEGEVDGVDEANGRVTVIINIFGRSVPMELDHWQVEPL